MNILTFFFLFFLFFLIEKDGQHSIELSKYQQTIKEQAVNMQAMQKEIQSYKDQINDMEESLDAALRLETQLEKKEELIKQLNAQSNIIHINF
jgi:Skp family chaperone for outer membrane proteins